MREREVPDSYTNTNNLLMFNKVPEDHIYRSKICMNHRIIITKLKLQICQKQPIKEKDIIWYQDYNIKIRIN